MGLSCNKMLDSSKQTTLIDRTESWSKIGGYVFRPVFRNEINESVYEKSQISYNIAWRKHLNSMNRKQSFQDVELINTEFYSKFKDCIRSGVPDRIARDILIKLFCIIPSDRYWRSLKENFEGTIPDTFLTVPTFSSITNLERVIPKFYINSSGITALKRTLWALHKLDESINYCPQLPSLISLLLIYLNEEEVFLISEKLLLNGNGVYLIQEKLKFDFFVAEIVGFILKEIPTLSKMEKELSKVVSDMIRKMFIGYLRVNCLLRLMVAYLTEGLKILAKFIFTLFLYMQDMNFISTSAVLLQSVKLFTFSLEEIDGLLFRSFKAKVFVGETVESGPVSEKSSCLSHSKVLTQNSMLDILKIAQLDHRADDAEVVFSKSKPSLEEILTVIEQFPRNNCLICLFITTNFDVFGFFTENVMLKNVDNPDNNLTMVFELEPEQKIFISKGSGLVQISPKGVRVGGNRPALLLTEEMKIFIDSTEEFGDFGLSDNEFEVSICEILSIN